MTAATEKETERFYRDLSQVFVQVPKGGVLLVMATSTPKPAEDNRLQFHQRLGCMAYEKR